MSILVWILFICLVLGLLALDLGVFNRKAHVIKTKEAIGWTIFWVCTGLIFNVAVYVFYEHKLLGLGTSLSGKDAAMQFLTGYLVEKSLSIDNIFVIALIFTSLSIPPIYQHRILFWGIVGALVFRAIMILVGAALLEQFHWLIYVFGAFLIFTAIKLYLTRNTKPDPEENFFYRITHKLIPISKSEANGHFTVIEGGVRKLSILGLALIMVEGTDLIFALDSIPAIFAITKDPFIVFTSNVFAMLGLRSLFFALVASLDRLYYIKYGLMALLAFVGVKMLLSEVYKFPPSLSLGIIAAILLIAVATSLLLHPNHRGVDFWDNFSDDLEKMALIGYRQARRLVIMVLGITIVTIGVILIFLPGPGILVIFGGLSLLAVEFIWAKQLLHEIRAYWDRIVLRKPKTSEDKTLQK